MEGLSRIQKITTGLCPKCQKKANGIVLGAEVGAGAIGIKYGIKKYGPKILKVSLMW